MKLPAGSKANSILQFIQWLRNPLGYMLESASSFGSIFAVNWIGYPKIFMVSDPQMIKEVLTNPALTAPGEANGIARPLLGDNSVILLSGEQHQQRRKLLMPPFHGERMMSYGQTICDITEKVTSQWAIDRPFSAAKCMQDITLRVILQTVFGLSAGSQLEELKQALVDRLELTSTPLGSTFIFLSFLRQDWGAWSPWGYVMQKQRECDRLIYAEINERRAHPDPNREDILSLLLMARDEDGQALTDIELRDELMALLFAGHETTAIALTWALYWVHTLPAVYQRLMTEIDSLGDRPDPLEIFKLPYLTAVCNETLRIYPVAMLTFYRVAQTPVEIGGYTFEPGMMFASSIYLTHHRPDLYPEPQQFQPERFLDRQFSPYEFLPFGGGSRRCIGLALAQFEMKLVLATILKQHLLKVATDRPVKPVRRGALLGPSGEVPMMKIGHRDRS